MGTPLDGNSMDGNPIGWEFHWMVIAPLFCWIFNCWEALERCFGEGDAVKNEKSGFSYRTIAFQTFGCNYLISLLFHLVFNLEKGHWVEDGLGVYLRCVRTRFFACVDVPSFTGI